MKASELLQKNPLTDKINDQIQRLKRLEKDLQVVHELESCACCGSQLEFSIQTHWVRSEVLEQAKCGTCHQESPLRRYRLH